MYGEHVRIKAEGELRDAIAIPLFLAASAGLWALNFGIQVSVLGSLLLVVVSFGLVFMARLSFRDANSQVLYWISLEHITTTSIEASKEGLVELHQYLDSQPVESALE